LTILQREIEVLSKEANEIRSQRDLAEARVSSIARRIDESLNQLNSLETELRDKSQLREQINTEVEILAKNLDGVVQQIAEREQHLKELKANIDRVEAILNNYNSQISELNETKHRTETLVANQVHLLEEAIIKTKEANETRISQETSTAATIKSLRVEEEQERRRLAENLESVTREIEAKRLTQMDEIAKIRSKTATKIMQARRSGAKSKVRILNSANDEATEIVENARRLAASREVASEQLKKESDSIAAQAISEAQQKATLIVAEANSESLRINDLAIIVKKKADAEINELRNKANNEILELRNQAASAIKIARQNFRKQKEKSVESTKLQASALVDEAIKKSKEIIARGKKDAAEKTAVADLLVKNAQEKAKALEVSSKKAVNELQLMANAEIEELKAKVLVAYNLEVDKGLKKTAEIEKAAETKVRIMVEATQADYDTRIAEAKSKISELYKDAEIQAAEHIKQANEAGDAIKEQAAKEYAENRARLSADIARRQQEAGEEIKEWLSLQKKNWKVARKQKADDAGTLVRKFVESRATRSAVNPGSPFAFDELANELEQIIKRIILDESSTEKEKLSSLMGYDGSGKIKRRIQNRKTIKIVSISFAAALFIFALAFGVYNRIKSGKNTPNSGQVFASKVMNKTKSPRLHLDKQTPSFKKSYTENIIFTTSYADNEVAPSYQNKWIIDLNRFIVRELDINDKVLVKVITLEARLIRRLNKMAEKMTAANEQSVRKEMERAERDVTDEMRDLLGGEKNFLEFMKFKKKFYDANAKK